MSNLNFIEMSQSHIVVADLKVTPSVRSVEPILQDIFDLVPLYSWNADFSFPFQVENRLTVASRPVDTVVLAYFGDFRS